MDGSYSGRVWRTYNPFTKVQIFPYPPLSGCNSVGRMRDLGSRCRESESPHSGQRLLFQYFFVPPIRKTNEIRIYHPSRLRQTVRKCADFQKVSNGLQRALDSAPIEAGSAGRFVHNTRHQNIRAYGMVTIGQFYKLPSTSGLSHHPFTVKSAVQICLGVPM